MAIPILLDCDPGHDDAVAILLAAGHDAIDVLGVTTVAGNCSLELATLNARRVAALAGLDGVPIAAGAAGPLHGELVTAPDIHGDTGLDGYDLRGGEAPLDPRTALELMAATLEAAPDPVTVVATGPLTNVARLLSARRDLQGQVREVVLMGGSTGRGNVTPAAEFNVFVDPEAAAAVFASGLAVTMIGLNLTHQARATPEVLERVRAVPGEPARAVEGWLGFFGGTYARVHGECAPPMHDPCTIAMLIDRTLVRCAEAFVAVETRGRWTRGATVVDFNGRLRQPRNARVALELDEPRFWDLVIGALQRLARRHQETAGPRVASPRGAVSGRR
jgi:inosine-uridine nucleoside N-ribohydrolase